MAIELKNMTKSNWEALKKNAGIKSAKWYEKAHADVGGYIDKMQKARTKYKANKNDQTVKEYNSALVDLHKAFDKFLTAKEFKTDLAGQLQTAIAQWQLEASTKSNKLITFYKANEKKLMGDGADQLWKTLDGAGF